MSNQQKLADYLLTVKKGDKVLVSVHGYSIAGHTFTTTEHEVVKVTKSQILIKSNNRFKRSDGAEIGGSVHCRYSIVVPSDENKAAARRCLLERWAGHGFARDFAQLDPDQQLEIYQLVKAKLKRLDADKAAA